MELKLTWSHSVTFDLLEPAVMACYIDLETLRPTRTIHSLWRIHSVSPFGQIIDIGRRRQEIRKGHELARKRQPRNDEIMNAMTRATLFRYGPLSTRFPSFSALS